MCAKIHDTDISPISVVECKSWTLPEGVSARTCGDRACKGAMRNRTELSATPAQLAWLLLCKVLIAKAVFPRHLYPQHSLPRQNYCFCFSFVLFLVLGLEPAFSHWTISLLLLHFETGLTDPPNYPTGFEFAILLPVSPGMLGLGH